MNVPDGWRVATLGEVLSPETRREVPTKALPYIGMEHVASQTGRVSELGNSESIRSTSPLVDEGDVLYGRLRPYLNKVALAPRPAYASGEFIVLRGNDQVDAHWLKWRLTSEDFVRFATSLNAGDRPRVKWPQMAQFSALLPPLSEQRRIVEMVEEHLAHLDAADASLTQAEQRATALTASSAAVIVAEAARVGKMSTIGAHATAVEYGSSAKTSGDASGIPVLRMGNIQLGQLDWNSLKYLPKTHGEFPKLLLRDGDLLFNRTNSAELVGKCAVFHGERESSYASYLIRVRFDATVEADWVNIVINSPQGRAHIKTVVSQQVGQANVNGTKLRAFPLPVPDIAQQRELIAKHRHALDEAYRAEAAADSARRRSGALRRAVLAAAFAGRLSGAASDSDTIEEMAS